MNANERKLETIKNTVREKRKVGKVLKTTSIFRVLCGHVF